MSYLVIFEANGQRRTLGLAAAPGILGRSQDVAISLEDFQVSRQHAEFRRLETGDYWVRDLGSRNGFYLNRNHFSSGAASKLQDGDELVFGRTGLRFFVRDPGPDLSRIPRPALPQSLDGSKIPPGPEQFPPIPAPPPVSQAPAAPPKRAKARTDPKSSDWTEFEKGVLDNLPSHSVIARDLGLSASSAVEEPGKDLGKTPSAPGEELPTGPLGVSSLPTGPANKVSSPFPAWDDDPLSSVLGETGDESVLGPAPDNSQTPWAGTPIFAPSPPEPITPPPPMSEPEGADGEMIGGFVFEDDLPGGSTDASSSSVFGALPSSDGLDEAPPPPPRRSMTMEELAAPLTGGPSAPPPPPLSQGLTTAANATPASAGLPRKSKRRVTFTADPDGSRFNDNNPISGVVMARVGKERIYQWCRAAAEMLKEGDPEGFAEFQRRVKTLENLSIDDLEEAYLFALKRASQICESFLRIGRVG